VLAVLVGGGAAVFVGICAKSERSESEAAMTETRMCRSEIHGRYICESPYREGLAVKAWQNKGIFD
jgi:hypothetical protein